MKLYDLLLIINDYTDVIVVDTDQNILARYDGKDSIPEDLNEREIVQIKVPINTSKLCIEVEKED